MINTSICSSAIERIKTQAICVRFPLFFVRILSFLLCTPPTQALIAPLAHPQPLANMCAYSPLRAQTVVGAQVFRQI